MNYPGYSDLFMYELKIEGHIARNWGHVPICFKIGNVSPEFLVHVPDFNAYSIKSR